MVKRATERKPRQKRPPAVVEGVAARLRHESKIDGCIWSWSERSVERAVSELERVLKTYKRTGRTLIKKWRIIDHEGFMVLFKTDASGTPEQNQLLRITIGCDPSSDYSCGRSEGSKATKAAEEIAKKAAKRAAIGRGPPISPPFRMIPLTLLRW